jgi:hypothetical protein
MAIRNVPVAAMVVLACFEQSHDTTIWGKLPHCNLYTVSNVTCTFILGASGMQSAIRDTCCFVVC